MADLARIVVQVTTDSGFRATEIVADLRNTAETLFFPMHCVGFWDGPTSGHICPDEQRGQKCSHVDVEQPPGQLPALGAGPYEGDSGSRLLPRRRVHLLGVAAERNGALGGTRTHGLILRRDALYPTELQARTDVLMVPRVGFEPTRPQGALRPERSASAVPPPRLVIQGNVPGIDGGR